MYETIRCPNCHGERFEISRISLNNFNFLCVKCGNVLNMMNDLTYAQKIASIGFHDVDEFYLE